MEEKESQVFDRLVRSGLQAPGVILSLKPDRARCQNQGFSAVNMNEGALEQ